MGDAAETMGRDSAHAPPPPERWGLARRLGFRLVFAYALVYYFPAPLQQFAALLQWGKEPNALFRFMEWYDGLWKVAVPWAGKHVLHLSKDITIFPGGSGDTTYNYVQTLCHAAIALGVALVWSAIDFRRAAYPALHALLRVYLRYTLAFVMLGYGFAKVFKSQFPFPGPDRLVQQVGEMSPMGLLWTFMGYSTAYTVFAGMGEVLSGALLFMRRTTTLGALMTAGVMSNVVVMNFAYDVPVKLFSTHLLLTAVYLCLPDARRVLNVLVLNRAAPAARLRREGRPTWARVSMGVGKWLVVLYALGWGARGGYNNWRQWGDGSPTPPLYGLYEVESFTIGGEERPALANDATRWRRVALNRYRRFTVERMPGAMERFSAVVDAAKGTLTLTPREGGDSMTLTYTEPDADHLTLEGVFRGEAVTARAKRVDATSFLLVNRGFHWINEFPFNR